MSLPPMWWPRRGAVRRSRPGTFGCQPRRSMRKVDHTSSEMGGTAARHTATQLPESPRSSVAASILALLSRLPQTDIAHHRRDVPGVVPPGVGSHERAEIELRRSCEGDVAPSRPPGADPGGHGLAAGVRGGLYGVIGHPIAVFELRDVARSPASCSARPGWKFSTARPKAWPRAWSRGVHLLGLRRSCPRRAAIALKVLVTVAIGLKWISTWPCSTLARSWIPP